LFHGIDVLGTIKALTSPFDNLPLHLFKAIKVLIHCWQYIMVQVKSCPYKTSPAAEETNHRGEQSAGAEEIIGSILPTIHNRYNLFTSRKDIIVKITAAVFSAICFGLFDITG
jgi:hypothetical protein